jgi:hypothetical protein
MIFEMSLNWFEINFRVPRHPPSGEGMYFLAPTFSQKTSSVQKYIPEPPKIGSVFQPVFLIFHREEKYSNITKKRFQK